MVFSLCTLPGWFRILPRAFASLRMTGRAVGRIMGINKSTVYNWIKKLDEKLQDVESVEENIAVKTEQAEVIEMDELFDYIKEKKTELT